MHLLSGRRHSRLHNDSLEPIYFQVTLGRGKPETMDYADEELYKRRSDHLKAGAASEADRGRTGFRLAPVKPGVTLSPTEKAVE